MKHLSLLILLIFSLHLPAQIVFEKTYTKGLNETALSVIQTSDSGYAVLARINELYHDQRTWFLRIDKYGDTLWTKVLDGQICTERIFNQTPDYGYNLFLSKNDTIKYLHLNSEGVVLWDKMISPGIVYSIDNLSGGRIAITGSWGNKTLAICIDNSGTIIWKNEYQLVPNGGIGSCYGHSIREMQNGSFCISGNITDWSWDDHAFLLMIGETGDSLYYDKIDNEIGFDGASYSMDIDQGNNLYVGGKISHYFWDGFVSKFDSDGSLVWTQIIGDGAYENVMSVKPIENDGVIACGTSSNLLNTDDTSKVLLAKLTPDGNIEWLKLMGSSDFGQGISVEKTLDGGFVICGITRDTLFAKSKVLLIKTDENGSSTQGITANSLFTPDIFPNPASDKVIIRFPYNPEQRLSELVLTDVTGKSIINQKINPGDIEVIIDLNHVPPGFYPVKIVDGDRVFAAGKLIVNR